MTSSTHGECSFRNVGLSLFQIAHGKFQCITGSGTNPKIQFRFNANTRMVSIMFKQRSEWCFYYLPYDLYATALEPAPEPHKWDTRHALTSNAVGWWEKPRGKRIKSWKIRQFFPHSIVCCSTSHSSILFMRRRAGTLACEFWLAIDL